MKLYTIILAIVLLAFGCTCAGNLSQIQVDRDSLVSQMTKKSFLVARDCEPTEKLNSLGVAVSKIGSDIFDSGGSSAVLRSHNNESFLVTAAHVVENPAPEFVKCDALIKVNGTWEKTTIERMDTQKDLAILSIPRNLSLDSSLELEQYLGEVVFTAGYPVSILDFDQHLSVSEGVVATLYLPTEYVGTFYHRITAQMYFGNSGGGVWNEKGELVGVSVALMAHSPLDAPPAPYEGQYLIKPAKEIRELLYTDISLFRRVYGV